MNGPTEPVALLPWLKLEDQVSIGRAVFWPYEKEKHARLPDAELRNHLDKYAAVFRLRSGDGAPVTCISYPVSRKGSLSTASRRELSSARHALFAAAYVSGIDHPDLYNAGMYLPSADHFAVHMLPSRDRIAKGVFSVTYPRMWTAGPVGSFRISKPDHLHEYEPHLFRPLLEACATCLSPKRQRAAAYVHRALEWFFYAHSTQELFSEQARLVLLCMAIEAAVGGANGRLEFSKKVMQATAMSGLPRRKHAIHLGGGKTKSVVCNRLDIWAWDFYAARNAFVHADGRTPSLNWKRFGVATDHGFVAPYVWLECLWKALTELGAVPPKPCDLGFEPTQLRQYVEWYVKWGQPIDNLRDWWRDYISGQSRDL